MGGTTRLAGLCFVGLLVLVLAGQAWAKKDVLLVVDGREKMVSTFVRDVAGLLQQEKVILEPGDQVRPEPGTRLRDGLRVEVVRAGEVTLILGEEERLVRTVPLTVREFLAAQGVALGPEDAVEPGLNHLLGPGEVVRVTRISKREELITERIPFPRERRLLTSLAPGQRRILRPGQEGLRQRVLQVTYVNGKPVRTAELSNKVLRQPVAEIVGIGIGRERSLHLAARSAPEHYREVREMVATAYALHRTTAIGKRPGPGTVAVDPRVIPLGTRLFVEGYGYGRAEDVGSAIKGERIDVYFDTREEAWRWGRRKVKVYLLE